MKNFGAGFVDISVVPAESYPSSARIDLRENSKPKHRIPIWFVAPEGWRINSMGIYPREWRMMKPCFRPLHFRFAAINSYGRWPPMKPRDDFWALEGHPLYFNLFR